MKAFIIGLFSLALLASGTAWSQTKPPNYPTGPLPKIGTPAICTLTGGIIVIVLQKTGNVVAFACNRVDGKEIKKENSRRPGMTLEVEGKLGPIKKYKLPGETDPCYEWTLGGTLYVYCW